MLERIQYALFVLLFVLAGSLDGATPQGGACRVQPGMSPQAALHAPVTAQNYFTAAVMLSGDASIEIPAHSSEHKAIVRHRFYARSAAAEAVAQQNSALSDRGALYSKPVDYYIFSLGRILIYPRLSLFASRMVSGRDVPSAGGMPVFRVPEYKFVK